MKVLVACEYSGIVRDAFAAKGNDAWSCDILDTESKGQHIKGDVLEHLDKGWKMMIAHPPCTHLANTGARWFTEGKKPLHLRNKALDFVSILMEAPIDYICIENPVSVISSHIREADQMIQPYEFGHKEYKKTCLWLKNLPPLKQTNNVYEETKILPVKEKSKTWWMGDGKADRDVVSKKRSKFFTGIASAMADQWGDENKLPVAVEQLSIF